MHYTSLKSGEAFVHSYGVDSENTNCIAVDIGGLDVNGSLRSVFEMNRIKFLCVDMEQHHSVDIVVKPGDPLPFADESIDFVVSTSCFEHDPCFWLTFREMTRIVKKTGYIYINAPTAGPYHGHPGDNWRFYSDAGQALSYWSNRRVSNENVYPVKVVETFNILGDMWNDFVCVFKRCDADDSELNNITVQTNIINNIGKLEATINSYGLQTRHRC